MAFDSDNLAILTTRVGDLPALFAYNATADSFATVTASGYFNNAASTINDGDKILINTSTPGLNFGGTLLKNATTDVVTTVWDNTRWLSASIADVSTAQSAFICAPSGIITQIGGVLNTAITVASSIITAELAGVAITGGTLVFTAAMAAGTRVVADTTALNQLVSAGTIEFITDGGSTTASVGNFFAKMICPTQ